MAIVVGYMPVGFAENTYDSIVEIKLDGEEAIGKTATIELSFSTVTTVRDECRDGCYMFFDSNYDYIYFLKDDKFKKIIRKIVNAKSEARSSFNLYSDLHIKYFITFKILAVERSFVSGKIIKINDSANEPME